MVRTGMGRNGRRFIGTNCIGGLRSADPRIETDCFADEIVVDFPSVASAVDRIRNSFLADEHAVTLNAAIRLSPIAARAGATVPLEVPVPCTCHDCDGRGGTWTEACGRCRGSGTELRRHHVQVDVPAGVLNGACFNFTVTPPHTPPTRVELRVLVA